jgi:PAS domain S-box-containing protein
MEDKQFHALIEHSRDAVWLDSAEGKIVYASPASARVLGYSPADLAGANALDFVLPSDRGQARACFTGNPDATATVRLRRKDGIVIWADAAAASIGAENGEIVVSLHDVTAQRRAEQLLRESEQRFRALIENSVDGFVLLDREGRITYSGPPVLGFQDKELVGRDILELIHPDDLAEACANLAEIVSRPGKTVTAMYRTRHADGSWRWVESRAKNLLADPAVGGLVVNYRDVTERKRHEEESERAREEIRGILESIQESFIAVDREWKFTYANRRVASLIGKGPAELLGRNMWELFPDARESDFYPHYQKVMQDRVAAHFEMYYAANGKWFDVHAYPTAEGLSAYVLDISARKSAEQRSAAQLAVTRILTECSTLEAIAPRVVRAIGENLGWTQGIYWAVDERREMLRCAAVWPSAGRQGRRPALHKGKELAGEVWESGRSAWSRDAGRGGFAFPLLRGAEVLAVLEFLGRDAREPDAALGRLMDGFGGQIGHFLERRELEERLRRSTSPE